MKTFGFNTRMGAITYVIDQSVFLRRVVSSFCIEKLKYLFFLSLAPLLETPLKDTQIQIHLNDKLKMKLVKLFERRQI